jgi:hypothetical protein
MINKSTASALFVISAWIFGEVMIFDWMILMFWENHCLNLVGNCCEMTEQKFLSINLPKPKE